MSADESRRYDATSEEDWREILEELEKAVLRVTPAWMRDQVDDLVQKAAAKILAQDQKSTDKKSTDKKIADEKIADKKIEHQRLLNRSYLWKVATTTVIDETRRVCYQRERAFAEHEEESIVRSASPNPERQARLRQLAEGVRDCLDQLGHDRALAVRLYLLGEAVSEISERLDWGLKRAKNLVYRGLADMRACLSGKGYDDENG